MSRRVYHPFVLVLVLVVVLASVSNAQIRRPSPTVPPRTTAPQNRPKPLPSTSPSGSQPMKKATEMISKQAPIATNAAVLAKVTADNSHVIVSLAKQRAYLMTGEEIAIDSPISSGKRGHTSPNGSFSVLEKDKDHRSTLYGDYVDSKGRTVR